MNNLKKNNLKLLHENSLFIIIFTALLMQLLGSYYARNFRIGQYFYISWVFLRIIVPCFIIYFLKIPFSELGLKLPRLNKKMIKIILLLCIVLLLAFVGMYFFGGYLQGYSKSFGGNKTAKFYNFLIFTSSTLTGWEFLHRSFLLMGIIYVLSNRFQLDNKQAIKIAIIVPWIFEVVFHFIKPEMEAFGMLVGSPILSYIAIRTKSIWTAFFAHLYVEIVFICFVILK